MGTSVTVLGATGFAGAELLRLLLGHDAMEVVALGASSRAGVPLAESLPHLAGTGLPDPADVADAATVDADVCFSCLPGSPPEVAADVVIDLSDAHRNDPAWVYGLTEHARDDVIEATRVANPGCYPTAALLALVPLFDAGLVTGPVTVDALSGVSGAGRRSDEHLTFASADSNACAYGATTHRHVPEMERGLARFGGSDAIVSFTPHLVPMTRGLLVTARAPLAEPADDSDVVGVLRDAYAGEPFVTVTGGWPQTAHVTGTNRSVVSARVDERAGVVVASAAIDNLGKGAAGQALQNANVALGYEESLGLTGGPLWP